MSTRRKHFLNEITLGAVSGNEIDNTMPVGASTFMMLKTRYM